jgi:tetratricopeptide (TPR) repeat protein
MQGLFDVQRRNLRPVAHVLEAVSKLRRLVAAAFLLSVFASPAQAGELLGELVLEIDENARVTAQPRPRDGRFVFSVSRQGTGLTYQLLQASHPLILHWASLPRTGTAEWIELRLADGVQGVFLERPTSRRLVLQFTDTPLAADAMRARNKANRAEADAAQNTRHDQPLLRILQMPLSPAPTVAKVGLFRFPVGANSPVRIAPSSSVRPLPFGTVPEIVRGAWAADQRLAAAIDLADTGKVQDANAKLRPVRMTDDPSRALLSLARGHVWSRVRADGEPAHPSWAAEAYLSAVGLYPDAPWSPWARGQAAHALWRDLRFGEAAMQSELAGRARPKHPDRPWWEVIGGHARIAAGDVDAGLTTLAAFADGLPALDQVPRFLARKAVARALWRSGDSVRAAAVLDLLTTEHPALAGDPKLDSDFIRIYLDAGRKDGAQPRLERLRTQAPEKVDRERASWWLHEVALTEGDEAGARILLAELLNRHPGSVLAPLARVRLAVLEAMARANRVDAEEEVEPAPWPALSLQLRQVALQWPRTAVEDEALSIVAQLWLEEDLLVDGLELSDWVAKRTPGEGGSTDHEGLVCEYAPKLVMALIRRGEPTRALGRFRQHLDDDRFRACVSPELEDLLIQAALDADLPQVAIEHLTRSVTLGASPDRLGAHLVQLANLQRRQGRLKLADRTLAFVRNRRLSVPDGATELAQAELDTAEGRAELALAGYLRAEAAGAPSTRLAAGRAEAYETTGQYEEAAAELETVVAATQPDAAEAQLRLADLRRRVAKTPGEWEAVLAVLDGASEGRPADWVRTDALFALERAEDLKPVLERLATESDAFGHWARELASAAAFEESLDSLVKTASNP